MHIIEENLEMDRIYLLSERCYNFRADTSRDMSTSASWIRSAHLVLADLVRQMLACVNSKIASDRYF